MINFYPPGEYEPSYQASHPLRSDASIDRLGYYDNPILKWLMRAAAKSVNSPLRSPFTGRLYGVARIDSDFILYSGFGFK